MRLFHIFRLQCIFIAVTTVFLTLTAAPGITVTHAIGQQSVSAAVTRWGASAVPSGALTGQGPLVMTWSINQGIAYQYFDIVNVGQTDVLGQSFFVTNVYEKSGNAKPPTVTFEACINGVWSSISNTCSGQVVTMGTTTTEFFSSLSTPLSVNDRLSARARTSPGGSSSYTTTINVLVSRDQIRAGVTINF